MARFCLLALAPVMGAALCGLAGARVLRCPVEDAREPVAGRLERTETGKPSIGRELLYDTTRQEMTLPDGAGWRFALKQAGAPIDDMIAVRVEQGPLSSSQMMFRLRDWAEGLPFLLVLGWDGQSGHCRPY